MARVLVMVAAEDDPPPPPRVCGHIGCDLPGTVVTSLVRGIHRRELHHCEDHGDDGPSIGHQLGYWLEGAGDDLATVFTLTAAPERDIPKSCHFGSPKSA